jgi:hypothetical protein
MKKLIVLGLIACFSNVALAEDGSFTGTVDMGINKANQINIQRINEQHKLTGRSKASNGGIVVSGDNQAPKIVLTGRRGD